ncbi:MAG: DUF2007 domain-containing protein [Lysobacter sp.]|nr:DUF2007 domain-containing protein [Lysobacter sp.]
MLIVYRAANIADAHLMRQLLENEGIPAFIQGEYLQGAVGELPANTEILVHVADENADAARVIVDEWESAEPVELEDELSDNEAPPEDMPQRAAGGGYSLAKAAILFLCIVIGGALAASFVFRYAQG